MTGSVVDRIRFSVDGVELVVGTLIPVRAVVYATGKSVVAHGKDGVRLGVIDHRPNFHIILAPGTHRRHNVEISLLPISHFQNPLPG
jgi:hypothetical protein